MDPIDGLSLAAYLQDPEAFERADLTKMTAAVSKIFDSIATSQKFWAQQVLDSTTLGTDAATFARAARSRLPNDTQALATARTHIEGLTKLSGDQTNTIKDLTAELNTADAKLRAKEEVIAQKDETIRVLNAALDV